MHRVLISRNSVEGGKIVVTDASEIHHLHDVLRLNVDDLLECIDGQGNGYRGRIEACTRNEVAIRIEESFSETPPRTAVTLVQALVQPARFDWVIQKATELNVARIIPLQTERTKIRLSDNAEGRLKRWQRIAQEATKQSRRATVPQIESVKTFEACWPLVEGQHILIPTLEVAGQSIYEAMQTIERSEQIVLMIGPEGDFTKDEVRSAQAHGAVPVSLGAKTLRAETAAIALLAVAQYAVKAF